MLDSVGADGSKSEVSQAITEANVIDQYQPSAHEICDKGVRSMAANPFKPAPSVMHVRCVGISSQMRG